MKDLIEKIKKKYFQLFIYGLMCSFAFAPFYLFFLFFISFDALLTKLKSLSNFKKAFFYGWWWGFGYFLGNCYWLISPLTFDFPKYILLIPFCIIIIPAILSCYVGIISGIFCFIKREFLISNKFILAILFSLLWFSMEVFRSYVIVPFPWNLIAYSTGFSRMIYQIVRIIGTFGFCFVITFLYTAKFVLRDSKYIKYSIVYIITTLTIFSYGFARLELEKKDTHKYNINVRLVQPNFLQDEKNQDNLKEKQFDELIQIINYNNSVVDVVILPETAIPYALYNFNSNTKFLSHFKQKLTKQNQIIISGLINIHNNKIYNSLFIIKNGEILNFYDKYYLAPFGEYIPFRKIFPKSLNTFIGTTFSSGDEKQKIIDNIDNFIDFSPIICYESLFPTAINKKTKLIVNITNDIWFGKTTAVFQHFDALKFRAVENNIPAIRVANSGITAYINKYGKVIKKTKLNEKAILDFKL